MLEVSFPVKTICWSQYEQTTPILLQEDNGPCPLLAIVNTLLLQADVDARNHLNSYGSSRVHATQAIRSLLQNSDQNRVSLDLVVNTLLDYLHNFSGLGVEAIAVLQDHLPSLVYGLDVDINLINGTFSKNGLAQKLFSAFGLAFVHGWCREPTGCEVDAVFEELQTYDALQDFQLRDSSTSALQAREWMKSNSTQLTEYGLKKIDELMAPDLVAIFFRNNHFSTLYKGKDNGFYLLITDRDFCKHDGYTWQSLNSISGDEDLFFTGDLVPIFQDTDIGSAGAETDLQMAKALQEEEDVAMAKALQRKLNMKKQKSSSLDKEPEETIKKEKTKEKKKSHCVVS